MTLIELNIIYFIIIYSMQLGLPAFILILLMLIGFSCVMYGAQYDTHAQEYI